MIPIKDKKYMINCQGPYDYMRYMGEGVCTGEKEEFCGDGGDTFVYGFKIPTDNATCFFLEEEIVAEIVSDKAVKTEEESHTVNRTYYHDFGFSGQEPDYESMAAYLLDMGIVYLGNGTSCNHEDAACLFININDYFVPAADGEDLPLKDIPKLFDMYRKDGYYGVYQYVADKRGVENKHWKNK